MFNMHVLPRLLRNDETLPLVREDTKLGDDVVIVDGKPVKRDPQKLWIRANVQPLNGVQLNLVPEGDRETENLWLFSVDLVSIGDKVMRGEYVYQVQDSSQWGDYWQARITREDTDSNAASEFDNMPTPPAPGRRLF